MAGAQLQDGNWVLCPTSYAGQLHRACEAVPTGKQPLLFNKAVGTFPRGETQVRKSWSSLGTEDAKMAIFITRS